MVVTSKQKKFIKVSPYFILLKLSTTYKTPYKTKVSATISKVILDFKLFIKFWRGDSVGVEERRWAKGAWSGEGALKMLFMKFVNSSVWTLGGLSGGWRRGREEGRRLRQYRVRKQVTFLKHPCLPIKLSLFHSFIYFFSLNTKETEINSFKNEVLFNLIRIVVAIAER